MKFNFFKNLFSDNKANKSHIILWDKNNMTRENITQAIRILSYRLDENGNQTGDGLYLDSLYAELIFNILREKEELEQKLNPRSYNNRDTEIKMEVNEKYQYRCGEKVRRILTTDRNSEHFPVVSERTDGRLQIHTLEGKAWPIGSNDNYDLIPSIKNFKQCRKSIKWELMDSAPKDGRKILGYSKTFGIVLIFWENGWKGDKSIPKSDENEREIGQPVLWSEIPLPFLSEELSHNDNITL